MFFKVTNPFNPHMSHTHGRPGIFTFSTIRIARLTKSGFTPPTCIRGENIWIELGLSLSTRAQLAIAPTPTPSMGEIDRDGRSEPYLAHGCPTPLLLGQAFK